MTVRQQTSQGGLRAFMNKGGFWRFLALVLVYMLIYLLAGRLVGLFLGDRVEGDLLDSVTNVFLQLTASLLVGGAVLVAFAARMGWLTELFARQTMYRSRWMWLGPVLVLVPVLARILGLDWAGPALAVVVAVMLTGLLIGFVEELLYRGIGIKMMRDGGHPEWLVALATSGLFALSHTSNLLAGQSLRVVAPTVVYTVAFGCLMYLTLRTTRYLVWAMLLHGLTDPTTILATGGVDNVSGADREDPFLLVAAFSTFLLIGLGWLLLVFVRGRVGERPVAGPATSP